MTYLQKLKLFIKSKSFRFSILNKYGFYKYLSDEEFLKKKYLAVFNKQIDLSNPLGFNEKIQWLKLYDRKKEYSTMVDKFLAKEYVKKIVPEIKVIKTIGVWNKASEIDFSILPKNYVLKCTHDSGGIVFCRNGVFSQKNPRKYIKRYLKRDFFYSSREWPYKNVQPRIIAEEYLEDGSGSGLMDYKFYCFNGEPKFLYISKGLDDHATASISFVNLDWSFAPYERKDYKPFSELPERPARLQKMIEIAKKLSKDIPFLRVDLYQIGGEVYFSELTFSPCAGFMPFRNQNHDLELGEMIHLPQKQE